MRTSTSCSLWRNTFTISSIIVLFSLYCFSSIPVVKADDSNLMAVLYDKLMDIVVPDNRNPGPLSQVLLFEGGGLTINREDFDQTIWARNSFVDSMPQAMEAKLVDRVPRFAGTMFIDSGARISTLWGHLMTQYYVPVYDNPVVNRLVDAARATLANATLDNAYFAALDQYTAEADAMLSNRDNCLVTKAPALCAQSAVYWNERRVRRWFTMEVAKRELLAAQAQLLALQTGDLKTLFATSLEQYASNEKADVGAASLGQSFYDTQLTPSNWWTWWPLDKSKYNAAIDSTKQATLNIPIGTGYATAPTMPLLPAHGFAVISYSGTVANITYTPTRGFTGGDTIGYVDALGVTQYVSIAVTGSDASGSNPAFTSISMTSTETSSVSSNSAYSRVQSASAEYKTGVVSITGSFGATSYSQQSSLSSSSSVVTIQFEFAKVSISRPWLDTSLLSYYPVAMSGLPKNAWSDGLVQVDNPQNNALHTFKVLPTAFLVARNIQITSTQWGTTQNAILDSSSGSSSGRVSLGPFYAGSSSASGSNSRSAQSDSSFNANTLVIKGPQIIGWLCTPLPAFPTASVDEVDAYAAARSVPATPTATPATSTNTTTTTTK